MNDRSRRAQKWVTEEFYKVLDVYGFRAVMFVEWGFRPADVRRTTERIKLPGAVVKEWVRTAEQEQKLAEEAEASSHRESAAEFYYRAALYFGPACGVTHANTPRKLELYKRLVHCYTRFTELFEEGNVRRVEIPFENGKTIPGILQTVPGAEQDAMRGGDPRHGHHQGVHAEPLSQSFPPPRHGDPSHRRPGARGEQCAETWVTLDNFERAGKGGDRFHRDDPRN